MALPNLDLYRHFIFPTLRLLSVDDHERAHTIALWVMSQLQKSLNTLRLVEWYWQSSLYDKPVDFCGVTLRSAIGFAAGLDKNAAAALFLQSLGFGFGVVGSTLPYPQSGNPRRRLFRLMSNSALINRMGFNSKGSGATRKNLLAIESRLSIPIGVSLGKNKDTVPEEAYLNYVSALEDMPAFVPFYVVNVSSPNTPGLRDLQGKRYIEHIVRSVVYAAQQKAAREHRPAPPVLVKIAPDLVPSEIDDTLEGVIAGGASGLVGTNTTTARPFGAFPPKYANEEGGLSGDPLFEKMMWVMRYARKKAPNFPMILVGGINSVDRAKQALEIGPAIKIHTPLVFQGPPIIPELKLAAL